VCPPRLVWVGVLTGRGHPGRVAPFSFCGDISMAHSQQQRNSSFLLGFLQGEFMEKSEWVFTPSHGIR
jgi:hypothetical protein